MRVAVALCIVLVAVLLVAGCYNARYVQEQDIQVVKILHNGTLAWMKTIDYGNDEEMRDIIQTDDGNYVVAGGSSPKNCHGYANPDPPWYIPNPRTSQLIGLSSMGEIIWQQNYSFNGDGGVISVFGNPDHNLDIITKYGELWHLNPDGSVISHRSTNLIFINSAVKTNDGGYVTVSMANVLNISGSNITRLDHDGNIVWQTFVKGTQFSHISPVVELSDQHGYLFGADNFDQNSRRLQIFVVRLNPDGIQINETPVAQAGTPPYGYLIQPANNGYIMPFINSSTTLVRLNPYGTVMGSDAYDNISIFFTPAKDQGFVSITFPSFIATESAVMKNAEITRIDRNGTIQWKNIEMNGSMGWTMKKAIQTSDDDFVIMFARKKMSQC